MKASKILMLAAMALLTVACKPKPTPTPTEQYSKAEMWCELPTTCNAAVDVFYVVSTCIMHSYLPDGTETYTSVLTDEEKATLAKEIRQVKKEIFPDSLNFFAPYYHETTMAAAAAGLPQDSLVALSTKSQKEVAEAFDYYMAHYNQGRPFIVAGYSQGAIMTISLLRHMTDEQYGRMVAAYVMGYGINDQTLTCPHIVPATGADDTGVTITFNSMDDPAHYWDLVWNHAVTCINPISWTTDTISADFVFDGEAMNVHVDDSLNVLVVKGFHVENHPWIEEWELNPFPKGNYHNYEITFYNPYLRQNALNRCRHFLRK